MMTSSQLHGDGDNSGMRETGMDLSHLPTTLLDLLANAILLDNVLPYLSLPSIFNLLQTSREYREFTLATPNFFRCLDLSRCRGAYLKPTGPIDRGGNSWRSQRMDENLTEDEFLAGPLRGIFSKLSRLGIMKRVHVLILDELACVTADLISDILTGSEYEVRLLSVIGCPNLNHRKLQQVLSYICRPSRPEETPKLKGLYVFGTNPVILQRKKLSLAFRAGIGGIMAAEGAQLGSLPANQHEYHFKDQDPWYAPSGQVVMDGHSQRTSWEETLQVCKGIVAFDAVSCSHMHTAMAPYWHEASKDYLAEYKPGVRPMATISLGPDGCTGCGTAPKDAPVWGETDFMEFPLLRPPPFSGRVIDAVRVPGKITTREGKDAPRRLIVSCSWCLANRYCHTCHRWWCGECYDPKETTKIKELEKINLAQMGYGISRESASQTRSIKVFNGACVANCLVGEMMAGAGSGGMWG